MRLSHYGSRRSSTFDDRPSVSDSRTGQGKNCREGNVSSIDDFKLIFDRSSHQQLLDKSGLYARMWESQMAESNEGTAE